MVTKISTPKILKIILFIFSLTILFILYVFNIIQSFQIGLVLCIAISINVWFIYVLLIPKEFGRVKYRRFTVLIISVLFTFFTSKAEIFKKIPNDLFFKLNQLLKANNIIQLSITEFSVIISLIISALLLFFANYLLQDKSVMKEHRNSFDETFPEREFSERLKSFCNFLKIRIDLSDNEANWSDAHFTSLDAEVETYTSRGKESRITNLIRAIKKDHSSKVFLVLGDPGSGKSVALRKLCRDLISEVLPTRKIPIYLNLKEWATDKKWDVQNPPTPEDMYSFCINFLKGKDIFADDFIDKYFKRLYENGHLFFIVDSFDEIPAVLDVDESSWLIDKLSEILFNFLGGAHESRGVLASRYFRKPTNKFNSSTTLNVRPFSHYQINQALHKYILIDKDIIKLIFSKRSDLLPIASNPFAIGLIYSYLKDNDNKLPNNQDDLFSSYIKSRLNSCKKLIKKNNFNEEIIRNYAIQISAYMLNKDNFGLEASFEELKLRFPSVDIGSIIEILVYARIGRIGSGEEKRFSFVHRRFNEYFIVQKYLTDPSLINMESIPIDSRFRDSLVLYSEIAPEHTAIEIAEYCWNEIKLLNETDIIQFKRSIHCLRFLIEAYRLRLNLLNSFRKDLSELIVSTIGNYETTKNQLLTKIAVEATGILEQEEMQKALLSCFKIKNWWINQTAMQSCKHLTSISKKLEFRIVWFIQSLNFIKFLNQKDELLFSLSLSEPFKNIKKYAFFKYIDILSLLFGLILLFFATPLLSVLILVIYLFTNSLASRTSTFSGTLKPLYNSITTMAVVQLRLMFSLTIIALGMHLLARTSSTPNLLKSDGIILAPMLSWLIFPNKYIFNILFTIAGLLLFPFLDIFYFMNILRTNVSIFKKIWKGIVKTSFTMAAIIAVILLLLNKFKSYIDKIAPTFLIAFAILFSLSVLLLLFVFTIDFFKYNTIIKNHQTINRCKIASDYKSISFDYFRNKYVLKLQNENIIPKDNWPDDFSLVGGADSIILLSQLDEKWLGLN
jgi:hypothetical protein